MAGRPERVYSAAHPSRALRHTPESAKGAAARIGASQPLGDSRPTFSRLCPSALGPRAGVTYFACAATSFLKSSLPLFVSA